MHIGVVIARLGGVDGVALETEKWVEVLKRMGHTVSILTGELEAEVPDSTVVPELAFSHPGCAEGQADAFFEQKADEGELVDRLHNQARHIERSVRDWVASKNVDVLLTENATTLPCHLTLGLALKRVIEGEGIRAVSHNHDFYWERGDRYKTRYPGVQAIIEECFPPRLPNLRHAVINTYCRDSLKKQMGITPVVVPNVMDFEAPFGRRDGYNADLPAALGMSEGDIPLFQITRIVRRKGIEAAIELVERLRDPKVKLFVTGNAKDDPFQEYYKELTAQVERLGLGDQVRFVSDRFHNVRKGEGGGKIYSLSDGYAHARAMTYFSTYEGFGNAFVEALVARVPVFVNNYKPVYWPDIGSKGFKTVQIEDLKLTDEAFEKMREIVYDREKGRELAEFNFELGQKHFSYEVLEGLLGGLFN